MNSEKISDNGAVNLRKGDSHDFIKEENSYALTRIKNIRSRVRAPGIILVGFVSKALVLFLSAITE